MHQIRDLNFLPIRASTFFNNARKNLDALQVKWPLVSSGIVGEEVIFLAGYPQQSNRKQNVPIVDHFQSIVSCTVSLINNASCSSRESVEPKVGLRAFRPISAVAYAASSFLLLHNSSLFLSPLVLFSIISFQFSSFKQSNGPLVRNATIFFQGNAFSVYNIILETAIESPVAVFSISNGFLLDSKLNFSLLRQRIRETLAAYKPFQLLGCSSLSIFESISLNTLTTS